MDYCDLIQLQEATEGWGYVNFSVEDRNMGSIELPPCEPCNLEEFELIFNPSNETGIKRIIVFIRLWQKLKQCFSLAQLRDISEELNLLVSGSSTIHSDLIRKLAAFKMLHREFGLPLNNGTAVTGAGVNRTHILAIWKDYTWVNASAENRELLEWALETFVKSIGSYAVAYYGSTYRSADFIELLKENLNPLSEMAGFDFTLPDHTWNNCPFKTIRFADYIAKFLASDFSYGEFLWVFANKEIGGDNPFPLQSASEACCYPLDTPDNETDFPLAALREKLCEVKVTEEELAEWNWQKIEGTFTEKFCVDTSTNTLLDFAEKFLPNILTANGYNVSATNRQFRVEVTSNAPLWNTVEPQSPFNYDSISGELWYELPLDIKQVYEKLSRIRQLKNIPPPPPPPPLPGEDEQQAVKDLLYLPYAKLAPLAFIFSDFSQVKKYLIEEVDEQKRWEFFKTQFALFYKRTQCITEFIAQFTDSITCMENEQGKAIAWKIIKNLYADENFPVPPATWENADGSVPTVTWPDAPNGGAFASLLGTLGNGLICNFYDLNDNLLWRDMARSTDFFGDIENEWNAPVPAFVPSIGYHDSTSFVTIRNGFAIENSTAQSLGGAQAFRVKCFGIFLIDEGSKYTFMAGQATPSGEAPLFDDDTIQQWCITLKKEQKEWNLLSHNWDDIDAPPHTTTPIKLKRGAYNICIEFIQPAPDFDNQNKVCPQTTGFQLKYSGADTGEQLITIPLKQLFSERKNNVII